jgi:hypothetical protein
MLRKAELSASTSELNDELLIADAECFAPPLRRPGLRLSISESDPGRLFEGEDLRAIRRIQGNEHLIMLPQEVGQQIPVHLIGPIGAKKARAFSCGLAAGDDRDSRCCADTRAMSALKPHRGHAQAAW